MVAQAVTERAPASSTALFDIADAPPPRHML